MARRSPTAVTPARDRLLTAATELFCAQGYVATAVDEICRRAGVTKGAFFHHFDSKEALAEVCLARWGAQGAALEQAAPFQALDDPVERLLACMDFYIALFSRPQALKSCLAGTVVQEVSETHPGLRAAAGHCFAGALASFRTLLDAACRSRRRRLDTASLAELWMGTIQGSLILCKASGDASVIRNNLSHVRTYVAGLLAARPARRGRAGGS